MDFGSYFRNILEKQGISISFLTQRLNIKSKNEVYRLFQNKCSYEKSKELTRKIFEIIDVSKSEKSELYRLMNECKLSYTERSANSILSKLYQKQEIPIDIKFTMFLDFIKKNLSKRITVYIGMITESQCVMLRDMLNTCSTVRAVQLVNFNTSDENIAKQLFGIVTFFQNDRCKLFESCVHIEESVCAIAEDDKKCKMAVFEGGNIYESDISKDMAIYIYEKKSKLCEKELKLNKVRTIDYIQMLQYTCVCVENETYAFHGMVCLGEVPYEILYKLFEETRFFGFPRDHPYIKSLFDVAGKLETIKKNKSAPQYYFLSREYVKNFLRLGVTSAYINEFRPLNLEERVNTLGIFERDTNNGMYRSRFFKDDYDIIPVEICSVDGFGLYITSGQNKRKETYMQAIINHPKARRVFKTFSGWFWDNCMYGDEQSLAILNEYIEEYKKI